jgi:5-(aminomethyl)-3-furanmethanol phosphate kinase
LKHSVAELALTVIKLGGAISRDASTLQQALEAVGRLAPGRRLLIVPGGGAFADQVRITQRTQGFSDDTAHWMAILAMDQVAHLIAGQLAGARLIDRREDIAAAHDAGQIPVLAPYAWVRTADPLPHSWDITSDSIAAFIAHALGAHELVLVKPIEGPANELVDRGFAASCPPGLRVRVVTPATLEAAPAG